MFRTLLTWHGNAANRMVRRWLAVMALALLGAWALGCLIASASAPPPGAILPVSSRPPLPARAPANDYTRVINSSADAQDLNARALQYLNHFGLAVTAAPVVLVSAQELDRMVGDTPYKGAEIGFVPNEERKIYMMAGLGRDAYLETLCHEYTHIWQYSHLPRNQSSAVMEGIAQWVQYRVADAEGHTVVLAGMRSKSDPVYGEGLRCFLAIEEKYGVARVLEFAATARRLEDAKAVGVTW